MTYSESEPDSSFVINLVSNFAPTFSESKSESESESESSSILINLGTSIFFFILYLQFSK